MPPRWGLLFPDAAFLHKCRPAGALWFGDSVSTQMLMKYAVSTQMSPRWGFSLFATYFYTNADETPSKNPTGPGSGNKLQ